MCNFYAKIYYKNGKPFPETIEEHTINLLENLDLLKRYYKDKIEKNENFWNSLKIACLLHDLGKISSQFQFKIKKLLKEKANLPKDLKKEIPHNYLSGIFFYLDEIRQKLDKNDFENTLYAVLFHHSRQIDFSENYFEKIINEDMSSRILYLTWLNKFNLHNFEIKKEK